MIEAPRCWERGCIHYVGIKQDSSEEDTERPVCAAFPDGIPDAIAYGPNQHTEPFDGDHGIQFEQDPSRNPAS